MAKSRRVSPGAHRGDIVALLPEPVDLGRIGVGQPLLDSRSATGRRRSATSRQERVHPQSVVESAEERADVAAAGDRGEEVDPSQSICRLPGPGERQG